MAWRMIAGPRTIAKQMCVKRIAVWRLDEQQAISRQQIIGLYQYSARIRNLLDQVEHEDQIELFRAAVVLHAPVKVAVTRLLGTRSGIRIDIDNSGFCD